MKLRMATMEDLGLLISLRLKYLRTDFGSLSPAQEQAVRDQLPGYFAENLGQRCFVFLAEEHEEAAGSAFLLVNEKPASPAFPSGKTGTVMNVYTKPVYRRRGIARALMEQLIEKSREMELSYLELKATEDGRPLYLGMGFVQEISKYANMRKVL